jgi:RHS repeat-associated protein
MATWIRLVVLLGSVLPPRDPSTVWMWPVRDPAAARQDARGVSTTLLPDGRWLIVGGDERPSQVVVYERASRTNRLAALLSVPRSQHTATVLPDGTVLVAGGVDTNGGLVATAERFDPASSTIAPIDDAAFAPRARHTATLLTDGRVLFSGGVTSGGGPAELWDPATNRSLPLAGVPARDRLDGAARLMPDGRVRFSGGVDTAGHAVAEVEQFDPESSSFVEAAADPGRNLPEPPRMAFISPADGALDVPVNVRIAVRFSEPVDPPSIARALTLAGPGGVPEPIRIVAAEGGMLAFVTPEISLPAGTEFTIAGREVRAQSGRTMGRWVSTFTTRADAVSNPDEDLFSPAASQRALNSRWRKLPPLQAPPGATAVAGQVLLLDGEPLRDVTLQIDSRSARSDATGRFVIDLGQAPSGWKEMAIDARTADHGNERFGFFQAAVQIVKGRTSALPFTIWMPRLDTAHAVHIPSPTREETIVTTPAIPLLELHLPPNTVIKDHEGRIVREISVTAIPVDRPPFPLPSGVGVPVYFTIQPGGAYVYTSGSGRKGAWLVYPNYHKAAPGTTGTFWHYDPEERGWYVYALGSITPDGRQGVPTPDAAIYEFTGAMFDTGLTPGNRGGNGPPDADPVDLSTGEFVMDKTDLLLPDVIPLALTRTYRTGDGGNRAFGIGSLHPYAMFLWSAHPYTEVDLILADGKQIHYLRTSSGTGYADAVFEHTSSPTAYYKSTVAWNGNGWDLTLKDGTVYVFGNEAPLQSIRDRYGNTLTLTWSNTNQWGSGTGNIVKVTSPNGRWIGFTYDGLNRITQAKDNIGRTVGYEYDAAGNLWKVTDARGGVTEHTYDIAHRMLTIKDPRNIIYLTNEYETSGRVSVQTQADSGQYHFTYTTNAGGQVTRTDITNPRGYTRRVDLNSDLFMTSDIRALGETIQQTTTFTRATGSNRVDSFTDALGRVTHHTYDANGEILSVTRLYGTANAVTTSYTYDTIYSELTSVTDPLNHTTTITYESQGRLAGITDALNHQTTFAMNSAGQIVSLTDPLSNTTTFNYDFGDLINAQSALGYSQSRFVDAGGRVACGADANGTLTRFDYNAHNQITRITDALNGQTTFTYDGNGNLLTRTDARGKLTTWTYDNMNRVLTRTDPLNRPEGFAYDLNGNLTQWTDRKLQRTTYTYDALDRRTFVGYATVDGTPPTYASTIQTTYDSANRPILVADSSGGTISRVYDGLNRLTQEATPDGEVSYTYDAAGRRETMTIAGQTAISYGHDDANRLTSVTQGASSVTIANDAAGRRTSLTLPNGVVTEYSYDGDSRLIGLTYKRNGVSIGSLSYVHDPGGRRTGMGGTYARTNLPQILTNATYDDANQISTWSGTSFTYDGNGNLTNDGARTYTWNARNQLAAIEGPIVASFVYDAFGRRRAKTVGAATTGFLYDGQNAVQELSGGSVLANLLTGLRVDEYYLRTDSAGASNYVVDGLGSTLALTGSNGAVQTEYTFEPFGGGTTTGTATGSSFVFTARESDGTGLLFYRARYYDPRLQRFLSEDPIGYSNGDATLYTYASNAPTLFTDPTGMFKMLPLCTPPKGNDIVGWLVYILCSSPSTPLVALPDILPVGMPAFPHFGGGDRGRGGGAGTGARGPAEYGSKAPRQVTPGVRELDWERYNRETGEYERSKVYYDEYGRQIGRTDWTDHGRSDVHTDPHHHVTTYGPGTANGHESPPIPGPYVPGGHK